VGHVIHERVMCYMNAGAGEQELLSLVIPLYSAVHLVPYISQSRHM